KAFDFAQGWIDGAQEKRAGHLGLFERLALEAWAQPFKVDRDVREFGHGRHCTNRAGTEPCLSRDPDAETWTGTCPSSNVRFFLGPGPVLVNYGGGPQAPDTSEVRLDGHRSNAGKHSLEPLSLLPGNILHHGARSGFRKVLCLLQADPGY